MKLARLKIGLFWLAAEGGDSGEELDHRCAESVDAVRSVSCRSWREGHQLAFVTRHLYDISTL